MPIILALGKLRKTILSSRRALPQINLRPDRAVVWDTTLLFSKLLWQSLPISYPMVLSIFCPIKLLRSQYIIDDSQLPIILDIKARIYEVFLPNEETIAWGGERAQCLRALDTLAEDSGLKPVCTWQLMGLCNSITNIIFCLLWPKVFVFCSLFRHGI